MSRSRRNRKTQRRGRVTGSGYGIIAGTLIGARILGVINNGMNC